MTLTYTFVPSLLFALGAASVSAQDNAAPDAGTPPQQGYVEALQACQAIADGEARLACFDKSVTRIVGATETGEVAIVSAEEVRETRRGLFGFSLPKIKLFSNDSEADAENPDMLTSTITSARRIKRNAWVFQIADGDAVWQINNAPARLRDIEPGSTVVFKKASLGTYFIRIDGQLGVKGRRIR